MINKEIIINRLKELTTEYKGEDNVEQRLTWLKNLIDSFERYLPPRVVAKIKFNPAAKMVEGERRTITVVFADLSGFTSLSETMDPEDIAHIINNFFTRMLDIVFKYEGSVDKFLGDALMVLFGAPVAHHDDPERAVRAALEMQETMKKFNKEVKFKTPLAMSIGINTGPAVALNVGSNKRMEYTVIGDTVNLSARLEKVAQAGEIIISNHTYQYIADIVDAEKKPAVRVKGKRKPVKIYRVKGINEHYRLPDITALQLIGRKQELKTIKDAIEVVQKQKGILVAIGGTPGTGKTRLGIEAVRQCAQHNFTTLNTRCLPYKVDEPYAALRAILNDYFLIEKEMTEEQKRMLITLKLKRAGLELNQTLPFIGVLYGIYFPELERLPPEELKNNIFDTVKKLFIEESSKKPILIRIEDLQWCDPSSREFFDYFIEAIEHKAILLLCEYRSDYAFPWFSTRYCKHIMLNNFSQGETREYIKKILMIKEINPEITELVFTKSDGNPLFVQEIVKFLLKNGGLRRHNGRLIATQRFAQLEIAQSISDVILDQTDRMDETTRHILQYASVLGRQFKPALLSKIINLNEADLKAGLERLEHFEGVLVSSQKDHENIYEFISPTTYEVIYGSLFKTRRKELHTQIGELIEQTYSQQISEFYEELSYHFSRSFNHKKAISYSKLAAEKSFHLYALKESINFFNQALIFLNKKELSRDEMQDKLEILRRQGWIFKVLADLPGALINQKRSLHLARKMSSLKDQAGACLNIGIIYQEMGNPQKSLNYWIRARRIAKKISDQQIEVLTINNLGNYYLQTGDLQKALEYFTNAEKISYDLNNKQLIALANTNLGEVFERMNDLTRALEYYKKAYKSYEQIDDKENVARCLNQIGLLNLWLGNMENAMNKLNQSYHLAQEIGDKLTESLALGNIGLCYAQSWQLDQALKKFSASLALARITNNPKQNMLMNHNIGDIHQFQGKLKLALEHHKQAIEIAQQIQDPFIQATVERSLGWDQLYLGNYNDALTSFSSSEKLFKQIGDRRNYMISLIGELAVKNYLGPYQEIEEILKDIASKAKEINDVEILSITLEQQFELHFNLKEYNQAKNILEELPDLLRKYGNKRGYAWTFGRSARLNTVTKDFIQAQTDLEKSNTFGAEIADMRLVLYNMITRCLIVLNKKDYSQALEFLMQTISQAHDCAAREFLCQAYWLSSIIFKELNQSAEQQNYEIKYKSQLEQMTTGLEPAQKNALLNRIELKL